VNYNSNKWELIRVSALNVPWKDLGIVDTASKTVNLGDLIHATLGHSINIKAAFIPRNNNSIHRFGGI
jgi:hypothetical protein